MQRTVNFILIIGLWVCSSACEFVLFDNPEKQDPVSTFEYLWNECNNKYSYFEYKGIDWEEVHSRYRPMVSESIGHDSLFTVLASMLNELRDAHVNLVSPFNVSHYDIQLTGPQNVNGRNVQKNYLGDDFQVTGPFNHNFIDDGNIGYIFYPSFANTFTHEQLDYIFTRYKHVHGLIFDLRSNGGGTPENIYKILDRLSSAKTLLYYSYLKSGPGHEEFASGVPAYSSPIGRPGFKGPFVVLTNRGTYSAASFFTLGARELPNCTIMGDTTGGGLGLPNGGQLPNGWTYRFSVSRTLTTTGENYENGIPPDIISLLTPEDEANGIDTLIEDAIKLLK